MESGQGIYLEISANGGWAQSVVKYCRGRGSNSARVNARRPREAGKLSGYGATVIDLSHHLA
jgi:hypothetical protein